MLRSLLATLVVVFALACALACAGPRQLDLAGELPETVTRALHGRVELADGTPAAAARVTLRYRSQSLESVADDGGEFRLPRWNVQALPARVEARWNSEDGHVWHAGRDFDALDTSDARGHDLGLLRLEHTTVLRGRFLRPEYEIHPAWILVSGGGLQRRLTTERDGSFVVELWPSAAQPVTIEAYVGELTRETSEAAVGPLELDADQTQLDIGEVRMREIQFSIDGRGGGILGGW